MSISLREVQAKINNEKVTEAINAGNIEFLKDYFPGFANLSNTALIEAAAALMDVPLVHNPFSGRVNMEIAKNPRQPRPVKGFDELGFESNK